MDGLINLFLNNKNELFVALFSGIISGLILLKMHLYYLKREDNMEFSYLKEEKSKERNRNMSNVSLTRNENSILIESLNTLVESLQKDIKKNDESYTRKVNLIEGYIKSGTYRNLKKAEKIVLNLFEEIIENSNSDAVQKTVEGISSLFLLTNNTHGAIKYYNYIDSKFPDLPRNDEVYNIFYKYNVEYPVSDNGNIVLRRIDISHFGKIYNKLNKKKGYAVRFKLCTNCNISKEPTSIKNNNKNFVEWFCTPGYIILNQENIILGGSLTQYNKLINRKLDSDKGLSRLYNKEEIQESLVLMKKNIGYRVSLNNQSS